MVTPVFHGGVIVFYCTSSGIFTAEVVRDGAMDEESIEKYILSDRKQHSDCSDSSYLADNLANLRVLVDANQQVRERLMKLLEGQEMKVVSVSGSNTLSAVGRIRLKNAVGICQSYGKKARDRGSPAIENCS